MSIEITEEEIARALVAKLPNMLRKAGERECRQTDPANDEAYTRAMATDRSLQILADCIDEIASTIRKGSGNG